MKREGILVVVSGFSGAGKGTVMKELVRRYDCYALSVSATTRGPRAGEVEGIDYFYKTEEQFRAMIEHGELVEYARYVDHFYGTPKAYVEEQLAAGKDVILEIEIQGALKIKKQFPDTLLLFITPPSAQELVRRLTERAEALGVEIYLDTPATAVKLDAEGKVCGVTARTTDGTVEYDVACSAAIIATGGFGDNVERIQEELGYTYGEDFFGMRLPGHDGDGIDMAWAVGAGRSDFNIEMIFDIFRPGSVGRAGSDVGLIMKQPNLLVNLNGERFFNEEHVENTTYCGNALAQQKNNQGFMILDESIKNEYVEANSVPFTSRVSMVSDFSNFDANLENAINSGYTAIVKADTVEELADKMGINRENLLNTVAAYNEICASGKDPLGKDAQFLKPIDEGPFYAASYFPSSYGTLGGIKINSELEVLTQAGEVIPGLYSAGTDSCTIYGDSYMFLLPGNTMGYSVNTGRFAGENAAAYLGK